MVVTAKIGLLTLFLVPMLLFGIAAPLESAQANSIVLGGRVVDENLQPLQEVIVEAVEADSARVEALRRLHNEETKVVARGLSDAEGWYRLRLPSAGFYRLRVRKKGRMSAEIKLFPLLEDRNLPRLVLPKLAEMEVTVRDPHGLPLEGAWVWMDQQSLLSPFESSGQWTVASQMVRTDGEGRARLVRSRADATAVVAWAYPFGERRKESASAVDLRLKPGALRSPITTDSRNRQVSGVLVTLGEAGFPVGLSDEEGKIKVSAVPGQNIPLALFPEDGLRRKTVLASEPPKQGRERIALEAPLVIHGRVLDAMSRRDLVGAVAWIGDDQPQWVRTGRGGSFNLFTLSRRANLRAQARGFFGDRVEVAPQDGVVEPPVLALYPAGEIHGWVDDSRGNPLAGVEVTSTYHDKNHRRLPGSLNRAAWTSQSARSDSRGSFRLREMVPGIPFELVARHPDWAEARKVVTVAEQGSSPTEVHFVLGKGSRVGGYVRDTFGAPVPQAELTLNHPAADFLMKGETVATTQTNAEGRYEWSFLPSGPLDMKILAVGYGPKTVRGLEASPPLTEWEDIVLEAAVDLKGRVVDETGEGVEGVALYLREDGGVMVWGNLDEPIRAFTAEDGSFVIDGLASGEGVSLILTREGYGTASVEGIKPPLEAPLAIEMPRGSRLEGRVVDETGQPLAGAEVSLRAKDGDRLGRGRFEPLETAEDGFFRFSGLSAGIYSIHTRLLGYQVASLSGLEVVVGQDIDGVEIGLKPGFRLSGTVRSEAEGAVVGARIQGRPSAKGWGTTLWGSSDGEGRFFLDGLPPGIVEVTAEHADHVAVRQKVEMAESDQEVEMVFAEGVLVSGLVISSGGSPIRGASVRLQGSISWQGDLATSTGSDGSFALERVPAGSWSLLANAVGYADGSRDEPLVVEDQAIVGLELELSRGSILVGKALGLGPEELPRLQVMVYQRGSKNNTYRSVTVGTEGRYRVENLAPGQWTLYGGVDGHSQEKAFTVEPGEAKVVQDLEFMDGLTLTGQVVSASGPRGGLTIGVLGVESDQGGWTETDHQGRFRVTGLVEGRYSLRVSTKNRMEEIHRRELEILSDREVEVRLDEGGNLAGFVMDKDSGEPLGSLILRLSRTEANALGRTESKRSETDSSGYFLFQGVAVGDWQLSVSAAGYEPLEVPITVEDGENPDSLTLELSARQGMRIRLTTVLGTVPDRATIAGVGAEGISSGLTQAVRVTEDGWIELHGFPSETVNLLVSALGFARTEVAVSPGLEPEVILPLGSTLSLRIPALEIDRINAKIRIRTVAGRNLLWPQYPRGSRDYTVASAGAAELRSIPPGTWRVEVESLDGRRWSGEIEAVANQHHQLTLE